MKGSGIRGRLGDTVRGLDDATQDGKVDGDPEWEEDWETQNGRGTGRH